MRDRYEYRDRDDYAGRGRYARDYDDYGKDYGRREREDERNFLDRAGDEVRSWFGDEEAERRRDRDERRFERENYGRNRSYGKRFYSDRYENERDYEQPYNARSSRYFRDDDERFGRERDYGRGYGDRKFLSRDYRDRDYRNRYYGERDDRSFDRGDRGFMDRAGDEVRSWFGDEDAERRRRSDERRYGRNYGGSSYGRSDYGDVNRNYGENDYDLSLGEDDSGRERTSRPRTYTYTEIWMIPGPQTGQGPRNYQRSDERIQEDVSERLTQHGRINAKEIDVEVSNGEVTLKGTVESRYAKHMAEDVADSVSGVQEVHNQLRVKREDDVTSENKSFSTTAASGGQLTQGQQKDASAQKESAKAKSA